jgi:hypothetical protein
VIVFNNNIVLFLEKRTKKRRGISKLQSNFEPPIRPCCQLQVIWQSLRDSLLLYKSEHTPQRAGGISELAYLSLWRVALHPPVWMWLRRELLFNARLISKF